MISTARASNKEPSLKNEQKVKRTVTAEFKKTVQNSIQLIDKQWSEKKELQKLHSELVRELDNSKIYGIW